MIGGFNTDIVLEGVVYHIQTEDKGAKTREIVTQIFREGAVVFTRRTPYPSSAEKPQPESALDALVRSQHVKLLQFVRAGGLKRKDLLEKALASGTSDEESSEFSRKTLTLGAPVVSALRQVSPSRGSRTPESAPSVPPDDTTQFLGSENIAPEILKAAASAKPPSETAIPPSAPSPSNPALDKTEELVLDDFLRELVGREDREGGAAAEAASVAGADAAPEVSVAPARPVSESDETLLDALPDFQEGEKCEIQLLSSSTIRSGEVQLLSVRIQSDRQQIPIPEAKLFVHVFGKTIRPITYSGWSDRQGVFSVEILVPHYTVGDGHVEIRAHTPLGERVLRLDVTKSSASK